MGEAGKECEREAGREWEREGGNGGGRVPLGCNCTTGRYVVLYLCI